MPSITICCEAYSSNLGDRFIAQSVKYLFNRLFPKCQIDFMDFSARKASANGPRSTSEVFATIRLVHHHLRRQSGVYASLSTAIKWWTLSRSHHEEMVESSLDDADLLIIGGGNLLIDNHLSFPLKLYNIIEVADRIQVPVVFLSCSVGERWSWMARRLVDKSLRREIVQHISVRDEYSRSNISDTFRDLRVPITKIIDPGIVIGDAYGMPRRKKRSEIIIGLGVTHPGKLGEHADYRFTVEAEREFWKEVAHVLMERGYRVRVFTNGEVPDQEFAEQIAVEIEAKAADGVERNNLLVSRPKEPGELLGTIASFSAIVAYRMHASIAAYSLGVPSVALIWDKKVEAWSREVGRERYALGPDRTPSEVVEALFDTLDEGIDEQEKRAVIGAVERNVAKMMAEFIVSGSAD